MAGMQDLNRIRAGFSVAVIVGLAGVLVPATAAATDAYVNDSSGHAGAPCTLPDPCSSINTGIGQATAGATVHLDGGTYNQNVFLGNGKSLIADDFAADGGATVPTVNGAASSAISFNSDAGTVQGLILHSDDTSNGVVALDRVATLSGNTFSTTNPGTTTNLVFAFGNAGGSTITGNTFNGSTTAGVDQWGVQVDGIAVTVSGNTFTNTSVGVWAHGGAGGTIAGNHISGAHTGTVAGDGIEVGPGGGQPVISGNTIDSPGADADGIAVEGTGGATPATGATIQRNRVIGAFSEGIIAEDTNAPVILDSNLVTGATTYGINAQDDMPLNATDGDVTATNMTVIGNATDLAVHSAGLTLDSSLVQDPISATAATCSISFSSGPTTTSGGNGCMNFQTTATPDLGGTDGFHLLDTPNNRANFIDHGNPAGSAGSLDLDGAPRRIDADGACPLNPILDMGAYELQPAQPDCTPPTTPAPSVTPTQTPKPKCKKHKKHGRATQAKKKCKRRK
jgi:hypothetical protein